MPHRNVLITLFNGVTNYEYWIVAEWNSRCRLSWCLKCFIEVGSVLFYKNWELINWCEIKKNEWIRYTSGAKLTNGTHTTFVVYFICFFLGTFLGIKIPINMYPLILELTYLRNYLLSYSMQQVLLEKLTVCS